VTEYVSDHDHQSPGNDEGDLHEPGYGARVDEDHLMLMHLLYAGTEDGGGDSDYREGFASLDSLREVSGLPAWKVWEIIEDLQELDLVTCIWVSGGLKSPSSADVSGETSDDLRFMRGTRAGLTQDGRAYPPLLEYDRLRHRRRREKPDLGAARPRNRQSLPTRPRYASRKPERIPQASRGYHIYRPRERAARRLAYLVCALCFIILVSGAIIFVTFT
jgi:hypothetical protein